jgi:transcriptional regulator with XRE-family HTH domain
MDGAGALESWLGAALAIGRDHLGLSLKDACRELAGVSDKTLMKWESGERLHPLSYAIELARRDDVTRSMLIQALGREGPRRGSDGRSIGRTPEVDQLAERLGRAARGRDGERILLMVEAMLESALGDGPEH